MNVRDVVTFGSPFQGTDYASLGESEQAREMVPGSTFLTTMNAEVRTGVLSWTSITSNFNDLNGGGDGFISAKSACLYAKAGPGFVCYRYDYPAYTHGNYKEDTNFTSYTDTISYRYAVNGDGAWYSTHNEPGAAVFAAIQAVPTT